MNNKRRIFSSLLSLFLLLGAVPAWAVSPSTSGSATRFNDPGSTFKNLSASDTTFCFLTRVGVEETDNGGERATCRLTRGPKVWTLEAILGKSFLSDADVVCTAHCYKN